MRLLPIGMLIYLAAAIAAVAANAAEKPTYQVNGKTVPTEAAIMASIRGQTVLKCVEVEARASATGTSIGLKTKK